jgi:hypothetical protein
VGIVGGINALFTDVNFQNHPQYLINLVLLAGFPATLTIPAEFFRHLKQKPSLANRYTLPPIAASE